MVRAIFRAMLPALFFFAAAALLPGQLTVIRVEASLVLIPAHVTNANGAIVANLTKSDFQITDDNIPQIITHFSMDDAPASIGLVYDCSGSMRDKMHQSAAAANAFFHTANPNDEFFLVEFGDRARLAIPFSFDPDDILSKIAETKPCGRTALLDALQVAMAHMKTARNLRKALVILSDGGDNQSRHNRRQIKSALLEADVQVYAMGLFSGDDKKRSAEEKRGPDLLNELTGETGGKLYPVADLDELPGISRRIGNDVRTQYVIGYSPVNSQRNGKYHRVKVTVATPTLRAYYRPGYYSR